MTVDEIKNKYSIDADVVDPLNLFKGAWIEKREGKGERHYFEFNCPATYQPKPIKGKIVMAYHGPDQKSAEDWAKKKIAEMAKKGYTIQFTPAKKK